METHQLKFSTCLIISKRIQSKMMKWKDEGENSLFLFSMKEFMQLPDGIELESINGWKRIKGKDYIDDDTRAGHIAYGIRSPRTHKHADLFLIFLLKKDY